MNGMQFTIELIDTLAWPVIAIIVLILFRNPLRELLHVARKIKIKDVEIEFGKELKSAQGHAIKAFPELKQDKKTLLIAQADHFPSTTIRDAWRAVDDIAEKLVLKAEPELNLDVNERYKTLEKKLSNHQLLDTKQAKLFGELRQLRNKVAHAEEFEVNKADAIQYVELCFRLIGYLESQAKR
jgi:hypothetical protein